MKRRETADERDRRIVAEGGPWACVDMASSFQLWSVQNDGRDGRHMYLHEVEAIERILNRIVREERRKGGVG